jgi:hypothetical protein
MLLRNWSLVPRYTGNTTSNIHNYPLELDLKENTFIFFILPLFETMLKLNHIKRNRMCNQLVDIVLSHYVSTVPSAFSQTFWGFGMFLSYTVYNCISLEKDEYS